MGIIGKVKSFILKQGGKLQVLFTGRYGMDNLSTAMLWVGIILMLPELILRTGLLQLLSLALYVVALFRMLSKNKAKRATENRKYLVRVNAVKTKYRQAKVRFSNRKEYKYVHCPNCRGLIRLPRGAGSLSVHCKACDHTFEQKA